MVITVFTQKPSKLPRNRAVFNKQLKGGTTFKEKATISILSVDAKAVCPHILPIFNNEGLSVISCSVICDDLLPADWSHYRWLVFSWLLIYDDLYQLTLEWPRHAVIGYKVLRYISHRQPASTERSEMICYRLLVIYLREDCQLSSFHVSQIIVSSLTVITHHVNIDSFMIDNRLLMMFLKVNIHCPTTVLHRLVQQLYVLFKLMGNSRWS